MEFLLNSSRRGPALPVFIPIAAGTNHTARELRRAQVVLLQLWSQVQHKVAELKPKAGALQRLGGESL